MKPELTAQILGMYIGRQCHIENPLPDFSNDHNGIITPANIAGHISGDCVVVPHLRRLESITEEECRGVFKLVYGIPWDNGENCSKDWFFNVFNALNFGKYFAIGTPAAWLYLLSKGFDLLGLIDAGLAEEVSE